MYCTVADVKRLTGYDVTADVISKAQAIVEIYTGKIEVDVNGMRDKALLGRATAFQSAYMRDNGDMIYEQVAASSIGQNDSLTTFKGGDFTAPWIAPLTVLACRSLSWNKSRSVHTGRIFQRRRNLRWTAE